MNRQSVNDERLIKASAGGNTQAFGELVHKYQGYICAVTFSAVGSVEKSEEIAQEVFVLAWKNLGQLRHHAKFKSWLYRITQNQIKKYYHRRDRDPIAGAVALDRAGPIRDKAHEPPEQAIRREQQDFVYHAIGRIPSDYREPLVLFYREGKSVKQVAAFFDLSENAAKKRLSRARQMVRSEMTAVLEHTLAETRPKAGFSAAVLGLIGTGQGPDATSTPAPTSTGGSLVPALVQSTAAKAIVAAVLLLGTGIGTYVLCERSSGQTLPAEPAVGVLPAEFDEGLVLYLSFDLVQEDSDGTLITDESFYGNHGRLTGGRLVKGRLGQALRCRAKTQTDGVIVPDHDSLDVDAVTIAAWIKTDRKDYQWGRILDKGWRTAYNLCVGGEYQGAVKDRQLSFETAQQCLYSKSPVVDGRWHFVVGTYDGQTSCLYVDGKPDGRTTAKQRWPMQHTETDIHIACLAVPEPAPHDVAFFDGLIDEIRLYNRILSEDEIRTLYRYQPYYED